MVVEVPGDTFATRVVTWGRQHGRRDLPWQQDPSPYRVWVSEIMLQQTRVDTVVRYFQRFMAAFPNITVLADASEESVLAHWSGLGYYARARNLHRAAKNVVTEHGGQLPTTIEALTGLPGIGRSTAGAIRSLGHRLPAAILDGNVKRVLARYHGFMEDLASGPAQRQLWHWSEEKIVGLEEVSAYTQHLMDLGAMVCKPQAPDCQRCPLAGDCRASQAGLTHKIPRKRQRQSLPLRQTCVYLLRDAEGRILLEKRPGTGIWGGLWSLPESLPGSAQKTEEWPLVRHTFTHFKLDIRPVLAEAIGGQVGEARGHWFTIEGALEQGLPAPVRRLLENLMREMESEYDPHGALQKAG